MLLSRTFKMRLTTVVLFVLFNSLLAQNTDLISYLSQNVNIFKPDMIVHITRCSGKCNKKYCNVIRVCRPVNRTAKLTSLDIYFHPHIKLEAPMHIQFSTYKLFRTEYRPFMIKLEAELCKYVADRDHPTFKLPRNDEGINWSSPELGNLWDPCPYYGHRYLKPKISNSLDIRIPLIPVGDWKLEYIISKKINGSNELILTWVDHYEVKPTSALEF